MKIISRIQYLAPSIILLLFLTTGSLQAKEPIIGKGVKECLSALDNTYSHTRTYQADVEITVHLVISGMDRTSGIKSTLAWEKPNKIYLAVRNGESKKTDVIMMSNGKVFVKYLTEQKEYIARPAPQYFKDSDMIMNSGFLGQKGGLTDIISSTKPSDVIRTDLLKATLLPSEKIDNKDMWVLQLIKNPHNKRITIKAYVEKKSGILRRMVFNNSAYLPSTDAKAMGVFEVTEEHKNIKINQTIKKDRFQFTPPVNVHKVQDFSFLKKRNAKKLPPNPEDLKGKTAPDFNLEDLSGNEHQLSSYRGKPVILDFWATWCHPCRKELPILKELADRYKNDGLVFFTINSEEKSIIEKFLKNNSIHINVLLDSNKQVSRAYNLSAVPQMVFIGKDGVINKIIIGALKQDILNQEIQELLKN